MPNQSTIEHDDIELTELFKDFGAIFTKNNINKSNLDWSTTIDFQVFSEFLINDIHEMQERLKNPDDDYLYYACRHIFNIQDWIKLIVEDAGFQTFTNAWEHLFDENFGDKHILQTMYDACFEKWVYQKNGQYKIGENFYNILRGKLYYRNRFKQWFEAEGATAFDLKPNIELIHDNDTIEQLNYEYKETWYDAIIKRWDDKQYNGALSGDFLEFKDKETNPDEYFDFTIAHVKTLLDNPISILELERWSGGGIADLEHMVKMAAFVLERARNRREDDSHTIYLLRDCLMFHEAQKIIDIITSEDTSSDQILIGRKLLTHTSREWGYYVVTLEALYNAHMRYPTNFTEFYNEYARLMDMFVSLNQEFASVIANLADYVKEHIRTDKNKIVVYDIGFQGSIALLTKYIIDRHICPFGPNGKIETDVKIGVGAEWSKKLFGNRHEGHYFPFLNRLQLMARSNELYHYKQDSLNSGKLQVLMGDPKYQHEAAIELVVLVMVALTTKANR